MQSIYDIIKFANRLMEFHDLATEAATQYSDNLTGRIVKGFASTVFFGAKFVYKVISDPGRLEKGDAAKAHAIVSDLTERGSTIASLLPARLGIVQSSTGAAVIVLRKLNGVHPNGLTPALSTHLAAFLNELHLTLSFSTISEYDGKEFPSIAAYAEVSIPRFLHKLSSYLTKHEELLIAEAVAVIDEMAPGLKQRDFVLIHKDLHLSNLLIDPATEQLTGVLDWDAAQTGPAEWEFAVILQRFPEEFERIRSAYHRADLDGSALQVCGLIQALRFWKSFPLDRSFIDQQKQFIQKLLYERSPLE